MYQPKLYLRFDKPIQNDKIGIEQLNKILRLIEIVYPEVSWWDGTSPSGWNPFTGENDDIPDIVKSLTIGYWPDGPNKLTYGIWDTNDYNYSNAIDGWAWFNNFNFDADETSTMFEPIDESIKRDWTIDDLKFLHDDKVLFYEIGSDGNAIKHPDIMGDDMGDILYIGIQDGRYTVCYKLEGGEDIKGIEECLMSSENSILKWLNDGTLQPTHKFINFDIDDMLQPINESNRKKDDIFRIGDYVIVNGYYSGDIGSSNNKIVYFDDDFAQIIDTYMGNDGLWYLLEFETKRINFPKSTPSNQIYLMNDNFDGSSFKMEITIEYPEELDLDTIFGYN